MLPVQNDFIIKSLLDLMFEAKKCRNELTALTCDSE